VDRVDLLGVDLDVADRTSPNSDGLAMLDADALFLSSLLFVIEPL
jgi:hypothetical protein